MKHPRDRAPTRAIVISALAAGAVATATVLSAAGVAGASTDGGRIAFARANQIYTISTAGTAQHQLTTTATGRSYAPRYSPDGSKIAFVREPTKGQRFLDVMNADGSNVVQLTAKVVGPGGAAWSPDGKTLAFGGPLSVAGDPGSPGPVWLDHIKVTARNGTPQTYVGDLPLFGRIPVGDVIGPVAWSRSGLIAYDSTNYVSDQGSDAFLLEYNTTTKAISRVTETGGDASGYFAHPTFSPSNALAYEQAVTIVGEPTSPPTIIGPRFGQVDGDQSPSYSPRGTRFVFSNGRHVFIANVTGANRHQVTTGYSPDWQPVG